jgi:hypothetical protein
MMLKSTVRVIVTAMVVGDKENSVVPVEMIRLQVPPGFRYQGISRLERSKIATPTSSVRE